MLVTENNRAGAERSPAEMEEKKMLTNDTIRILEEKGFKRWTKNNIDRMYINASQLGLVCDYYKTGNISSAWFQGVSISNCEAKRMKSAKTFIDVSTGAIHSDNWKLEEAAKIILENVLTDCAIGGTI